MPRKSQVLPKPQAAPGRTRPWRAWPLLALAAILAWTAGDALAATPKTDLVQAKNISDIVSLDPAQTFEYTGGEIINNVYTRLVVYDLETFTKLEGGAAESWRVSGDGLTISFKIRPGQKFHSGNPVRAEDAAFSLQRVVKLGLAPAFILKQYGWTPENVDEKVRVVDGELAITLDKPWAPTLVLNTLTSGVASVVDRETALAHEKEGDLGHEWLHRNSAGSGAFVLKSYTPAENVVLEANPDFHLGAPLVERVVYLHVVEPASQRLLLEKGDVDLARDLLPEHHRELANNPDVRLHAEPKVTEYYLTLNQKVEPLNNPKIWEALRWLIDYEALGRDLLGGAAFPHQSFIPKGVLGEIDDLPYRLDVDKAKALLAEAGYPDGIKFTVNASNLFPFSAIVQALQASFKLGGVEASLEIVDDPLYRTRHRNRQFETSFNRWSHDYGDPHSDAQFLFYSTDDADDSPNKSASWRGHWQPPDPERINRLALESDPAKRTAGYQALQREFLTGSPLLFILQNSEQTAIRANVEGFISGPAFDTPVYRLVRKN